MWQMTECNLSKQRSPRVHHTQTPLWSPASLSSPAAGTEILVRLLCLSPFVQRSGKEDPRNRRRVDHALIGRIEVLREPVGQSVCFTVRRPRRPLG